MPTMSPRQLTKAMESLRPGDVLTNLACACGIACKARYQILVLARVGDDRYDFSVAEPDLNIIRDNQGPWRWSPSDQVFVNKDGVKHPRITAEVTLNEAGGKDLLPAYRGLPSPTNARFRIDPVNVLGEFGDRTMKLQIEALLNRSDDTAGQVVDMQQAIDLIFAGSVGAVDERRMRSLLTVLDALADRKAAEGRRSAGRSSGLEGLLGSLMGADDLDGMPPELAEIFGGPGVTVMGVGDFPPGFADMIAAGLAGRPRREGGGRDSQSRNGNGHDRATSQSRG